MPPLLLAVGPFPPPVNGNALITSRACDRLSNSFRVVRCDTSVPGRRRSVGYHARRFMRHLQSLLAIIRHSRERGRVLYVSCPGGLALWYGVAVVGMARLSRYQIVVHHHSFRYLDRRIFALAALVVTGGRATTHVCLCGRMRARLREQYPRAFHVIVWSNAAFVLPEAVEENRSQVGPPLVLGHLSNLSMTKGTPEFIELVRAARREGLDVVGRIAGPTMSPEVTRIVHDSVRELGDALTYSGRVTDDERTCFLAGVDLFVFPTRYLHEAEPLVVFESMAAGVPVVAFARGCIPGQLADTGRSIPVEADFVDATLPFVRRLVADAELRRRDSHAARAAFLEQRRTALDEVSMWFSSVAVS
jgi:glycosyltransferase involved in cell wall biosynthesis